MKPDDPTIPDRLMLRALIEDGLPSRAAQENWPIREPWEFARVIFDSVYRCPYERKLAEPVFENIPKGRLEKALSLGLDIQNRGLPALQPLLARRTAT
jgi:ABC-type arginine/histidine transport system permease subunit